MDNAIDVSTRRFMAKDFTKGSSKGMKGSRGGKGYMGGGKNGGMVTTPMNTPKKGFKGY